VSKLKGGVAQTASDPLDDLLRLISRAYTARDGAACRQLVDRALALDSQSEGVHRWAARIAYREQAWPGLLNSAEFLLSQNSDNAEAAQFQARALTALQRWAEAAESWRRLTTLRPDALEVWRELANSAAVSGKTDLALSAMDELQTRGQTDLAALQQAAGAAVDIGDSDLARRLFRSLAQTDRAAVETDFEDYLKQGQLRGAAAALAALQEDGAAPDDETMTLSEALVRDAVHHERSDALLEACFDYAAALLLYPSDPVIQKGRTRSVEALLARAQACLAQGRPDEARARGLDLLRCASGQVALLRKAAALFAALADPEASERLYLQILEQDPRDAEALLQLARLKEGAQQFDLALDLWRRLTKAHPGHKEGQRALERAPGRILTAGRTAFAEGRLIEAARHFQSVPADSPQHEDARRRLEQVGRHMLRDVRIAYKDGRMEDVVALGAPAADILADPSEVLRLLARGAMKLRDNATGAEAWQRYIDQDSDSAAAFVGLGRCRLGLGDLNGARAAVDLALALEPEDASARQLQQDLGRRHGP
jgi:tetratricopeptide (TPR) repeat protein